MTTLQLRDRYIPTGSTKVEARNCAAVFYIFTNSAGKPAACAFVGKTRKPTWSFYFSTETQREAKIRATIEAAKASAVRKAESRAERNQPSKLAIGDILYSSWGYDQTNIDFYQVTRLVGPFTVEIRQVASRDIGDNEGNSSMSGKCVAVKDSFKGDPMIKRVTDGCRVKIESYASATPYDGRPLYYSWYA